MNKRIYQLLEDVREDRISPADAAAQINDIAQFDLGFANIDLSRKERCGNHEVIYAASKTTEQIRKIAQTLLDHGQSPILMTRLSPTAAKELQSHLDIEYDEISKIGTIGKLPIPDGLGKIAVVTAGTSDIPVAQEAIKTLEFLGNEVIPIFDVGVAGIHRLFAKLDLLRSAQVIIAIAGMEGAIASVVAGLTDVPVIAVPTSIGYGAAFEGITALLSMMNSCAAGVSVVNIDNGFGAAFIASRINHQEKKS